MKVCRCCGLERELDQFHKNAAMPDGLVSYCKPCVKIKNAEYHARNRDKANAASRRRYAANRDTHRAYHLKNKYDITPELVDGMLREQGNCCAICRLWFTKTPHVDHDHKTGRVRGLLCNHCNSGLGHFRDSPENLASAQAYLTRKSGTEYQ